MSEAAPLDARGRGQPGMLDFPCDVERLPGGNTLITDAGDELGYGSEVIEVDCAGQVVWVYNDGLKFAHSAKRLANGNTLIADTTNNRVIEVTPAKEIVFTTDAWGGGTGTLADGSHLSYPNDAHKIDGERLLLTDRNNNRAVIADLGGEVLWEYATDIHHPHNCDLLPDGNVIIADSDNNRVAIVNPRKEIVWAYGGDVAQLNWPRDADLMRNGNVLVADSKNRRVIQVSPAGQVVWEYRTDHFSMFYDADELDNGNILAADQFHRQVTEIDPFGNVVWRFRNCRTLYPIHARLQNGAFKRVDADGNPADWMVLRKLAHGTGRVHWIEENGRRFPGLEYGGDGVIGLFQVVGVKPGTTYRLAARIATAGLAPGSACFLSIGFMDEMNGYLADVVDAPKGAFFTGTTHWTQDEIEIVAPQRARAAEIRFLLRGPGRAWIRDAMFFG